MLFRHARLQVVGYTLYESGTPFFDAFDGSRGSGIMSADEFGEPSEVKFTTRTRKASTVLRSSAVVPRS